MRWLLIVVGTLLALGLIVVAVGYALPVEHMASRTANIEASPERVWQAITDIDSMTEWRPGLESAEITGQGAGGHTWREVSGDGAITYEIVESIPRQRLVSRITDKSLPFGGTWTYELQPNGTGTTLTIREDGEVYNPVFRFVSRFVMGHHVTIDKYHEALNTRLVPPR